MVTTQKLSRRMYSVWFLILFLLSQTTVAQGESELVFDLPSFSFLLKVSKADNALIIFQDRLKNAIHEHLIDFFENKIEIPDFGRVHVDEVALKSNLVWKKLSTNKENKGGIIEYEVQSDFDCEITVYVDSTENSKMRLSESIMDLFMIESFQGDNYWHLVHNFLSDETLEGITDVKITVFSDAYVSAYNSGDEPPPIPNEFLNEDSEDRLSPAMTAGVVFSFFFFAAIIVMWVYICFFVKKAGFFKGRTKYFCSSDDLSKATVADTNGSVGSLDFDFVDNETRWMDAWANSITSIPLRTPVKTKKRMRNAVRNPAKSHVTHLDSINEAASEDECSLASTTKDEEGRGRAKEDKTRSGSREQGQLQVQPVQGACIVNLASIDEEVRTEMETEEVQKGATPAQSSVPEGEEPDNSHALVVAKTRTISHWVSALNFRNNPLNPASAGATTATTTSQLPTEKNLNEIC